MKKYFDMKLKLLNKLQKIQNCSAWVVKGAKNFAHAKPILKSLHWLPISSRIEFMVALLTYKCLNWLAPQFLMDLHVPYDSSRQLRSSNKSKLKVPIMKAKALEPEYLPIQHEKGIEWTTRKCRKSNNAELFKKLLKAHHFMNAYGPDT